MAGYAHVGGPASSTTNGQLSQFAAASTSSTSSSFSSRISDFVERNKRGLTIAAGATVVVAGAAGYYYYTRPVYRSSKPPDSDDGLGGDEGEESPTSQRKKGRKKKSRKPAANVPPSAVGVSSPAPTLTDTAPETTASLPTINVETSSQTEPDSLDLTSAQINALPPQKRKVIASDLKTKGNKAYSAKRYRDAIDIYSKAIECDEQAVYYSNRAACFTNLGKNEEVVRDCSEALRLDPVYVKALNRRGQAREAIGGEDNLFNALCDFTAGAIIDGFQDERMAAAVDRVMKQLAQEKASKIMKDREPRLPTPTFIKAYMEAFRPKPRPVKPETPTQGEETLFLAFDALDARDYNHALSLFNEAIEQGISTDVLKARALNMTGTFKFIIGEASAALADLEESTKLDPTFTQTWVKKASVHMELSTPELAFESFEQAVSVDKEDPDIYYHRGQVYFITGQFEHAISEYRRSTELDKTFVFSQIQLAVAIYKNGGAEKAMRIFQRIIEDFGQDCPEVYNYYGEILMDRGEFTSAMENLDKAIALERLKKDPRSPLNVLPMVNKALCLYQSKQAFEEAESICRNALEIDPGCDIAVATLGQLLLQQNKVHEAVKAFARSAEIARTEMELQNALAYENATKAQLHFIEKYPDYAHKLGLAQARM